jgi:hypothetical protein
VRRLLLLSIFAFNQVSAYAQSSLPIRVSNAPGKAVVGSTVIVDGTKYATLQAALNAAGLGGSVIVPPGIWAQGSTPLTITGVSLRCEHGAVIAFSGLNSSTDAMTIQGWAGGTEYPVTVDGCVFITSASGSASGRDLIQVSGGDHVRLSNLVLLDPGRDAIHVEPACSFCWIENLTLDNIKSNTCAASYPGCSGTISASRFLRDDLNFSIGDKFPSSLTGIYINEVSVNKLNLRAHARYGEHWYVNNNCSGCVLQTYIFNDTHTDGAGRVPATTPDIYFDKGGAAGSNQTNAIYWASGGSEDTVTPRKAPVFKASGASIGTGFFLQGWVYSNFSSLFDMNFPADVNNSVFYLGSGNDIKTGATQWWKDGGPSHAAAFGLAIPGSVNGNDGCTFIFDLGEWSKRSCSLAGGGFAFYNASGKQVSQIDNSGGVAAGTSTVSALPAASSSAGKFLVVTDSTPVSSEGQRCVGGGGETALAFSNGGVWKCF